ncbi:MAG: response regulator [Dehalococcoidia bacterium]|nr:response regulator [Dehalococcoidia bacterium]
MQTEDSNILTPAEAARYLRVHRETFYDLIRGGTVRASKVGGRWRINRVDLDIYLQGCAPLPGSPGLGRDASQGQGAARWQDSSPYRDGQIRHRRVLVVDDAPEVREFFQVALNRRGHAVTAVSAGREAIEQVKRDVFDMVFIDLLMPDLDGVETLKAIKAIDPDPTVVLITGHPDGDLVAKALALGPFVLLAKPIRVSDLLKVVEG